MFYALGSPFILWSGCGLCSRMWVCGLGSVPNCSWTGKPCLAAVYMVSHSSAWDSGMLFVLSPSSWISLLGYVPLQIRWRENAEGGNKWTVFKLRGDENWNCSGICAEVGAIFSPTWSLGWGTEVYTKLFQIVETQGDYECSERTSPDWMNRQQVGKAGPTCLLFLFQHFMMATARQMVILYCLWGKLRRL